MPELKPQQLRIGNYLWLSDRWFKRNPDLYNTPRLIKVDSITNDLGVVDVVSGYNLKDLEPIPLTEEWLLKFGFEDIPDGDFEYSLKIRGIRNHSNGEKINDWLHISIWADGTKEIFYESSATDLYEKTTSLISELQFVHQLQNLYLDLTGKELKAQ